MSSGPPSDTTTAMRLGQAVSTYLMALPPAERDVQGPVLSRFVQWLGADRDLNGIQPIELERYQEQLGEVGIDPTRALGGLRAFLADARKRGWTSTNLSVHVKIRRKAGGRVGTGGALGEEPRIEMTQEGMDALQQELDRLENEVRPRLTESMQRAAADKDFRENAPYHAAKEELANVQTRINTLRTTISAAAIVERVSAGRVGLGSRVVLHDLEADEEMTFTLVGPGEIDARRGRISIQSPVAQALIDHSEGDHVAVQTPVGVTRYRIERIESAK